MKKNASFPKRNSDISIIKIKIAPKHDEVNINVQPFLPDFAFVENPVAPVLHSPLRLKVLKFIQAHGIGEYTSSFIAKNLKEHPGRVSSALYALKSLHGLVQYHRSGNVIVITWVKGEPT